MSIPGNDEHLTPEVMENIVNLAFGVHEACMEMCCDEHRAQYVRDLISKTAVVWCVWPDEHEENAYHGMVIKGADSTGLLETAALLVLNRSVADLARNTLGDGAPKVTHDAPGGLQ